MLNTRVMRFVMSTIIGGILIFYPLASLHAAQNEALLSQDVLEAKTVTGTLPGGEFAKIWLGVEPSVPEAEIRIRLEWDKPNAAANGLGFFILDEVGLQRAIAGNRLPDIATSSGNPVFEGADNQMDAKFKAFGLTRYTMVVFNDSNDGASFTATIENGTFIDESNQVTDPTAPVVEVEEEGAEEGSEEASQTEETATQSEPAAAAPAEAETTAETATDTAAQDTDAEPVQATTTVTQTSVIREKQLDGELTPGETHYLGLVPQEKDAQIDLQMIINPQDDTDLLRRTQFFVVPTSELGLLSGSVRASDLAIAAGNRVFGGAQNERQAGFNASGTGEYTILVNNSSADKNAQYTLTVDQGILVDDAGQTRTAQAAAAAAVEAEETAETEPETASTEATTTQATQTAPAASSAVAGTGDITPGSVYVVQQNDTLGVIAREAFGDVLFYRQICAFNAISDCNLIEVGDEIQIPTLEQLEELGDNPAPVSAAERPAPVTTPEPEETNDGDEGASATDEAAGSNTASETTDNTDATTDSGSDASTAEDTESTADGTETTSEDLLETATNSDDFNVLVAAVEAAGLEDALKGPGPLTVFAPTDAAFASLPSGVLDALLQDPGGQLTDVLLYHVVPGELRASDLADGDTAQTVQGSSMTFNETSSGFNINNDANIILTDIEASNGVIHVIDGVIQPVGEASAGATTGTSTTETASEPSTTDLQTVIENLPVLDDASDLSSEQSEDAISVSYTTESSIEEAATFYKEEMERSGYETTRDVVTAAAGSLNFELDDVSVQVGIVENNDLNVVTLTVSRS